jgi:nitrite reductase (NADH) large subunit
VVSDTLQTVTDPRIYAVGECAAHRGIAYGLVAPLFEQGKVLANHLAEFGIGRYLGSLTSTKLKVTGIDLFSAGDFQGGGDTEEIVMSDPYAGVYKSWSSRTTSWSAPACTATRWTAAGTSSCCARAAAWPISATS